jgi:hypothetical protein
MESMEEMLNNVEYQHDLDEKSTERLNREMDALEKIDYLCSKETLPAVENSKIISPIASVEESLAQFVKDSFEVTKKDYEFNQKLQAELAARLPSMTNSELITLHSNSNVNNNDRVSKMLGPSFSMITTKQQAEIAAAKSQESQVVINTGMQTMAALNNDASKDVLQGMAALSNLLQAVVANKEKES